MPTQRNITIDVLRTFAIVLMVVFHFIYDLRFFGYVDWNIPDGSGWRSFRHLILISFFLCFGASLRITHNQTYLWNKFWKRWLQITCSAAVITATSLIIVPQNYIYFGVLHFISVAALTCIIFAKYPRLSLIIGLTLICSYHFGLVSGIWPFTYFREHLPAYSNDYVGIFPWLGVVFIGIWLASTNWLMNDPIQKVKLGPRWIRYLSAPGQHSLVIYLVHQPLFFSLFGAIAYLTS